MTDAYAVPPTAGWGQLTKVDFEEAAEYARAGLPLDQKGKRMRSVRVPFDVGILNLIERVLNRNSADFEGQIDHFIYYCAVLVLRTLEGGGVPENRALPTPLMDLDQLSQAAEDALAMKRIANDTEGLDFVIDTALKVNDWPAVIDQLKTLKEIFYNCVHESMRRLMEQQMASRRLLRNAVTQLIVSPPAELSVDEHALVEWWAQFFDDWHMLTKGQIDAIGPVS